jgi:hypothetical protein
MHVNPKIFNSASYWKFIKTAVEITVVVHCGTGQDDSGYAEASQ